MLRRPYRCYVDYIISRRVRKRNTDTCRHLGWMAFVADFEARQHTILIEYPTAIDAVGCDRRKNVVVEVVAKIGAIILPASANDCGKSEIEWDAVFGAVIGWKSNQRHRNMRDGMFANVCDVRAVHCSVVLLAL